MSMLKSALLCGVAAAGLSGCASTTNPVAGTGRGGSAAGLFDRRGRIDDPRLKHFVCLRAAGLQVTEPTATEIQVGQPGVGPLIRFLATPGSAQGAQIAGADQGAEVIGSALLYPNATTSDQLLKTVERCSAIGVKG